MNDALVQYKQFIQSLCHLFQAQKTARKIYIISPHHPFNGMHYIYQVIYQPLKYIHDLVQ